MKVTPAEYASGGKKMTSLKMGQMKQQNTTLTLKSFQKTWPKLSSGEKCTKNWQKHINM